MADGDIIITIDADASGYVSETKRAERASERFGSATGKAGASAQKLGKETDKAAKDTEKLGSAARAAGGPLGAHAERMSHAAKAAGTLGATALGSVAVFTAVASAYAGVAAGIVAMTRAAIDYEREYRGIISITEEQTAALHEADRAFLALEAAAAQATVTVGASFAPELAEMARVASQTVLALDDLARKLERVSGLSATRVIGSLLLGQMGMSALEATTKTLDAATADYADEVEGLADKMELARVETDKLAEASDAAAKAALKTAQDAARAMEELRIKRLADEYRVMEQIAKLNTGHLAQAQTDQIAHDQAKAEVRAANTAGELAAIEQVNAAEMAAHELRMLELSERRDSSLAVASAMAETATMTFGTIVDLMANVENASERTKKAVKGLFRAHQLSALAQIAIDTLRASIALAVPPPIGLGPIAGPIYAAAQGGMSAAGVLAQKPPEFHLGLRAQDIGTPATGLGVGAGEISATLQAGEIVATREQARGLGAQEIVAVFQLDHRIYGAQRVRASKLDSPDLPPDYGERRRYGV